MKPANGVQIQDPEKFAASSPTTFVHEPRLLEEIEAKRRKAIKMQKLQHYLFILLILTVLSLGLVSSSNNIHHRKVPAVVEHQAQPPTIEDLSAKEFQELLDSVEPASLHEVLHKHLKEKYQHGVYQEDKTAMEVVHQQDAEVAQSLVELAKRQAGSTNGTVATVTPSSTVVVTSSQATTSTLPPSSTVVLQPTSSSAPPATPSTSATSVPASSTSPSASSQRASTSTAPTQIVSSTSNVVSVSSSTAGPKTSTKDGMYLGGYPFSPPPSNSSAYYPVQNQTSLSVASSNYPALQGYVFLSLAGPTVYPSARTTSSVYLAAPTVYPPVQNSSAVSAASTIHPPIQNLSSFTAQDISSITATVYAPVPIISSVSAAPAQSPIQNYTSILVAQNSSSVVLPTSDVVQNASSVPLPAPTVYTPVQNNSSVSVGPITRPPNLSYSSAAVPTVPHFQNASSTSANFTISLGVSDATALPSSNFNTTSGSTDASSSATSQGASSNTPASSTSPGGSSTDSSQASSTVDSSSSITQTSVYKTTLANGATSTVTSITVVPGQAGDHSGGGSGSKTNTANASLQTNGGSQKSFGINIAVGALGFAAAVAL